ARHDYEALPAAAGDRIVEGLGERIASLRGKRFDGLTVSAADDFEYHDPLSGTVAAHQGLRVAFGDDARIVLRRSGTGTQGVTLRLYLERLEARDEALQRDTTSALAALANIAEQITHIGQLSGRKSPSTIT
ncbi:MAG TPA: alpha-D-glucose phosphate-specific phosphoglucomutase, partial [Nevskiaceae bacterium]